MRRIKGTGGREGVCNPWDIHRYFALLESQGYDARIVETD